MDALALLGLDPLAAALVEEAAGEQLWIGHPDEPGTSFCANGRADTPLLVCTGWDDTPREPTGQVPPLVAEIAARWRERFAALARA